MFCKSCGKQIDNDSTFCSFCGAKQSTDLKPQVQADVNPFNQQYNNTTQPVYKNETNFSNSPNIVRQPKYDPTYKKEDDAMTIGIILLVIALIFAIVGPIKFEDRESFGQFRAVTAIVSLILRIVVTLWVVNIANRQNRETFGWGLFAFFLPSIALIVIATRKKLFANIQIVEGLDNEENSKILSDKAQEFYNDNKYSESIRFSEKAIELNPNNDQAKEVLKKNKISLAEINSTENLANENYPFLKIVKTTDGQILKIKKAFEIGYRKGDLVSLNDKPAPNGKYKIGWFDFLNVENGKIKCKHRIVVFCYAD